MRSFGILLLVLGLGSFVLPMMNLQFRIMSVFGKSSSTVAIVMAVVGAVLLFLKLRKKGGDQEGPGPV
jgi:uncharacterized membrane protein YeaQ/YmgE (transglycosylase-associated protein family)